MPKWPIISEHRTKPSSGTYNLWKEDYIAKDCQHKCVYCSIEENKFGGIRNFHVEHFRPKSRFPCLINNIENLFYACSICNSFKGTDWLCNESIAYIHPSSNYNKHFKILKNNKVEGLCNSSKYMVEKINLNRIQLIVYRKEKKIVNTRKLLINRARNVCKSKLNSEITVCLLNIETLQNQINETLLYRTQDIKRVKSDK